MIVLAAWLAVLEVLHYGPGVRFTVSSSSSGYKIFGVAFGLGVVSGIVIHSQLGTNWSELSRMSGPVQGPLLSTNPI
jgi:cytochrome bd ubiquinol oxidase subunit I